MASSARIDELRKKFDENPRRYFAPLANEYRKAGDLEQAIFICQEYLPQQPGHMSGHIVYGQALYELNRHEEAKAVFETALSLDPENLIALRHLGDIARQAGDAQNARVWYQRVLEADPRNEEIAQIMMSLLAPEAPAASPPAPAAPAVSSTAPTPLTTPAVSPGGSAAASAREQGTFEVEQSTDEALSVRGAAPEAVPSRVATPAPPTPPVTRSASKEHELLDLDDFDLGGVPLSDLRDSDRAETPAASSESANDSERAALEFPPLVDSDLSEGTSGASADAVSADAALEEDEFTLDPFAAAMAEPRMQDGLAAETGPVDAALPLDIPAASSEASTRDALSLDAPFEADPFAIAAPDVASAAASESTGEPQIEQATDLRLGLTDDGPTPTDVGDAALMDGLQTFEAGVFVAAPMESQALETESFFDTSSSEAPEGPDTLDAFSASEPVDSPEPEGTPAEAFVTETMAELYLQQGHLDSALDIYRKLVAQRPDDAALAERMHRVEALVHGEAAVAAGAAEELAAAQGVGAVPDVGPNEVMLVEAPTVPARSFGGPTIREFLNGLARRAPASGGSDADVQSENVADGLDASPPLEPAAPVSTEYEAAVGSAEPRDVQVDAPHTTDEFAATANASRLTPASNETVSESLGALFSGADADASDTEAANTLAQAFAPEGPETAPLQGVPAHRASSELSLDHVFKANTPPRVNAEREGFSFDQFFSDDAAERTAPASSDQTPPEPQASDDIAQFNAWLNGLKKT